MDYPKPPEWTRAAAEALDAYTRQHGRQPETAAISGNAARHLREYIGRDDYLLGIRTAIDHDIDGVEFR